jgi:hypothetical protein
MKVHILVTLPVSRCLDEAGSAALDLHTAARFLLDVLHVGAAMANDLSTQVEARNRL